MHYSPLKIFDSKVIYNFYVVNNNINYVFRWYTLIFDDFEKIWKLFTFFQEDTHFFPLVELHFNT